MPSQIGYFDTLKSAAGKVFAYLASITLTGTDGKTITCTQDTSLDEAVAMSSKAPKASPVFTGDVKGSTAGVDFVNVNPTNLGVHHVGGAGTVSLLDNQTMTFTFSTSCIVICHDADTGNGAAFFIEYVSNTITILANPSTAWAVTNSDLNPGWAIYKNSNDVVVTIKNYNNVTRNLSVNILGVVVSATAPV